MTNRKIRAEQRRILYAKGRRGELHRGSRLTKWMGAAYRAGWHDRALAAMLERRKPHAQD